MKTYKLGNKIKCIIRSTSAGFIGSQEMELGNQPYTVLKDIEASLVFEDNTSNAKSVFNKLTYSEDSLREITISNVELNDKILNLIFSKNEEKRCSTVENITIDHQQFQISTDVDEIFEVFVYNCNGELIAATDRLSLDDGSAGKITLSHSTFRHYWPERHLDLTEEALVFFDYKGRHGFNLTREYDWRNQEEYRYNSQYLTLDLIIEGNEDDTFNTSHIHIDRCALKVDKNMYFNRSINTVDLRFVVINDSENYITLN